MTPEEVEILADLDARGFIPGASENMAEFLQRVERIQNVHREFETALSEQSEVAVFDEFKVSQADLISPELMDGSFRVSLSRNTTQEELDMLISVIEKELIPRR